MAEVLLCKICGKRRPRRACLAVEGDICSICCGTEREVSLSCPLECPFLQEAHKHEKPVPVQEKEILFGNVDVSEEFVREQEELLLFCIYSLVQSAVRTAGAVDTDIISAIEALVQTRRTLESGLVYESRPENAIAAEIQRRVSESLDDYARLREEQEPLRPVRNSEILRVLVFLYRIGLLNQNGRPRGRMFLDLLQHMTPDTPRDSTATSGIIVGERF